MLGSTTDNVKAAAIAASAALPPFSNISFPAKEANGCPEDITLFFNLLPLKILQDNKLKINNKTKIIK